MGRTIYGLHSLSTYHKRWINRHTSRCGQIFLISAFNTVEEQLWRHRNGKKLLKRSIYTTWDTQENHTDRDPRFTGILLKELMKQPKVRQNLSTAFHSETYGQSETAFRTMEETLRWFVTSTRQLDWNLTRTIISTLYLCHWND